ncbi:MAG: 4Fe-4S binding protein [Thermodesulfobacteriota bacterium]|nr:4Fe-4S binding protein [Thermodesulfobacteriota bacterium]
MAKKGKHSIAIYQSWCKRCGICAAFCPAQVLAQDEAGNPYLKDPDQCTGCQLCQLRCPDFAINVKSPRKKEDKELGKNGEKVEEGTNA